MNEYVNCDINVTSYQHANALCYTIRAIYMNRNRSNCFVFRYCFEREQWTLN